MVVGGGEGEDSSLCISALALQLPHHSYGTSSEAFQTIAGALWPGRQPAASSGNVPPSLSTPRPSTTTSTVPDGGR